MRKIKEFNATNEEELLEQVMLWPKVDKEWDIGWKRIEPKKNKGPILWVGHRNIDSEIKKTVHNDVIYSFVQDI